MKARAQTGTDMPAGDKEDRVDRYRAAAVFHNHAAEYDDWFADSLIYATELEALRSLHTIRVDPKVEIGVGPGRFARDLGIAFGLDPARAPLRLALRRGIKCCQGIGEELPLKDRQIGAVYLLFTLCFGFDPQKIIEECGRVLMDGGYLVIGMIPAESPWGIHLAAKKRAGNIFYEHANFYTIATVRAWLAGVNMNIIEHRSTLYQPPGQVAYEEQPGEALDEQAGFVVIAARKKHG